MFTIKNITTRKLWLGVSVILHLAILFSCDNSSEREPDKKPEPVRLELPENFPTPAYQLENNPLTVEGVALGKKLFYDARLSRNNTISCGFCHMQPFAFTHHGHDLSHGVDDKLGRRNSLPIQNLIFYNTFFWDGGVHNMDLVALNAIGNEVEMDEEPSNIIRKLSEDAVYPKMFEDAFGTGEITNTHFLQALSQFLATMISANSRYDLYKRGDPSLMNTEELEGLALFQTNCSGCHAGELFTDQSYRNNGISSLQDLERDQGRAEITLADSDIGKFKVPSLRNVEYTAPYMHNGRLQTLEEVLNFYTDHIQETPTLDPLLHSNGNVGLQLTGDEKVKIIAFLKTLTDEAFLNDQRFSEH